MKFETGLNFNDLKEILFKIFATGWNLPYTLMKSMERDESWLRQSGLVINRGRSKTWRAKHGNILSNLPHWVI